MVNKDLQDLQMYANPDVRFIDSALTEKQSAKFT